MGVQKLALPFALACFLLYGHVMMAEAAHKRCKHQQPVHEHKPTFEIFPWQGTCLPMAVILGGCCGLVWWFLLVMCNMNQCKGSQNRLPQIAGKVELEEHKSTTPMLQRTTEASSDGEERVQEEGQARENWSFNQLAKNKLNIPPIGMKAKPSPHSNSQEERTEAGNKLDRKEPGQGNDYRHVEFVPYPPEQSNTEIWTYLEQELGKILLAIHCHRTTGQSPVSPMVQKEMSPPPVKPNHMVEKETSPPPVEKPNQLATDWQNFLCEMKEQLLTIVKLLCPPAADKQQPPTRERPSPAAVENQTLPSEEGQSSPHKERKKTPKRPRSQSKSKKKSHPSPSSRSKGWGLGRKGRSCRDY